MIVRNVALKALIINRANDRHGELENETAAIAWLFNRHEAHMRNLAKDIVKQGGIYELPLVWPDGAKFVVFDGNRRVTCLKLLEDPRRAPNAELQIFFRGQRASWNGAFPKEIRCHIENDRDQIDEILFRRHTGTQNGVGQSKWDDRIKAIFVARTGKAGGINVADEIEKRLEVAGMLPTDRKIPRSTMNRLLSAESFRNRLGFSVIRKHFEFTHNENVALSAMARVADDLSNGRIVLNDVWGVDDKRAYLDKLEREGILPNASHAIQKSNPATVLTKALKAKPSVQEKPTERTTLIPHKDFGLVWPGRLQRHHQIWQELQFFLELRRHPNAISVLFRVLLELSAENYIKQTNLTVQDGDKLSGRVLKIGRDLEAKGKLDSKQMGMLKKFQQEDKLVSADTLNRYVHSPNFAPSPEHLTSLWDSLSEFVVHCLKA